MKRWILLEEAQGPNGTKLCLYQHDRDYIIRVDGRELMSTRHHFSEDQLGVVACTPFIGKKNAKVLIGGLGLGFTLKAALATLSADAKVVVAEIIPEVVTWNKNPEYKLAAKELADVRTLIEMGDVSDIISQNANEFDAIMLDADNETTEMSTFGNSRLYTPEGLNSVYSALQPRGMAIYWAPADDPPFAKKMGRCGFDVEIQRVRISPTSNGKHVLFVGRKR